MSLEIQEQNDNLHLARCIYKLTGNYYTKHENYNALQIYYAKSIKTFYDVKEVISLGFATIFLKNDKSVVALNHDPYYQEICIQLQCMRAETICFLDTRENNNGEFVVYITHNNKIRKFVGEDVEVLGNNRLWLFNK